MLVISRSYRPHGHTIAKKSVCAPVSHLFQEALLMNTEPKRKMTIYKPAHYEIYFWQNAEKSRMAHD